MKKVTTYTDGACSGNPGPGGWAAILLYGSVEKELVGFESSTTNNRMELKAVICALKALKEPCQVQIHTDSAYVANAILKDWLDNWQSNGWKNSSKKQVKNIDLWQELIDLMKIHEVTFIKVKGHANDAYNNRCDELAVAEIKKNT